MLGGIRFGIVELVPVAILAAIGVALIVVLLRPNTINRSTSDWAAAHGLTLTDEGRGVAASYLKRTRTFRAAGAVIAVLAIPVAASVASGNHAGIGFWQLVLTGYLLGAVVAEQTFHRPSGDARSASLAPRSLRDYLPAIGVQGIRLAAIVSVGLVPVYAAVAKDPAPAGTPSLTGFAVLAGCALLLALGVEVLERAIVRRPQPVISAELLAVDDAIRSSSLHAIAGAGLAVMFQILSAQFLYATFAMGEIPAKTVLHFSFTWLAIVALILALASWIRLGRWQAWQVRRSVAGRAA